MDGSSMENVKELFLPFKIKEWRWRILLVGIIFVAVAFPCKTLLILIPGATEIRPVNMIPVVFGLLWGPAGAWGVAAAEALTDILSGYPVIEWGPGAIMNFFYAWLPYKLWYSISLGRQGVEEPRLRSVRDILRFIGVVFLTSLVTTTLIALLFEIMGISGYGQSAMLLFFNNFDFAVVLGIPLILLLTSRGKTVFWVPANASRKQEYEGKERPFVVPKRAVFLIVVLDVLLLGMIAFGILYFFASRFWSISLPYFGERILLGLFLVFEILYVFRPYAPWRRTDRVFRVRKLSIRAKVVLSYLLLTVFSVTLVGTAVHHALIAAPISMEQRWEYIFLVVGIALNAMFLVLLPFLHYVEKKITEPLELLAKQAEAFAERDHYAEARRDSVSEDPRFLVRTGDEIEGLSESFGKMMGDITGYVGNLVAVTSEKERIGTELSVATRIQASMLPNIFPAFPERTEFDIYAAMDPAREVGGDFYDFFMTDDDHLCMVMADVSGKGIPAALFMMASKMILANNAMTGKSPARILADTNAAICANNPEEMFVTVWLGILEISTGLVTAANAGHEYPARKVPGGGFQLVKDRHGFVLGGMDGMKYHDYTLQLEPGEKLFLYTDGVPEAENPEQEMFGLEAMLAALNEAPEEPPEKILGAVRGAVDTFVGHAEQFDDLTMLCLEYRGAGQMQNPSGPLASGLRDASVLEEVK